MTDDYLPGGLSASFRTIHSIEWKHRGNIRPSYQEPGSSNEFDNTVQGSNIKTLLQRSLRFCAFQVTGDPGYGDALDDEFSKWFYRIDGERLYERRLKSIMQGSSQFSRRIHA